MTVTDDATAFLAPPVDRSRVPAAIGDRPAAGPQGTEGPLIEPNSDEWFTTVSASKVPAITGASPWDSPYSLFRRMKGHVEPEGDDDVKSAGRYHEPGIAAWLRDQLPELIIRPCGTFTAAANPRHTAAPDRVALYGDGIDCVEIKTSRKPEEWGKPGTDQVPAAYRDQVDWQLWCSGAARCWIAVELPWFDHALYVVDRDEARIAALVAKVDAYLALLDADTCPPVDGHKATAEAQREVYSVVAAEEGVEFEAPVVRTYVETRAARIAAEEAERAATAVIVEALAGKREARHLGVVFAEWKPWNPTSKPKLYAARKLPALAGLEGAVEAPVADAAPQTPVEPDPAQVATVDPADPSAWILGRLRAIRDCGPPGLLDAVRRFWPADTPATGPWTDGHVNAIDALLAQVEAVDEVPYPPSDPRTPPAEPPAAEPEPDTLAWRKVTDRTTAASPADAADLKASIAPLLDQQRERLLLWAADARRANRAFTFHDGQATRRIAAINAAAIALVLHGVDGDDETVARFLIAHVTGKDLGTPHVGVALGSLGLGEAKSLYETAQRFGGGDPQLCQLVGDHLATTWT